MLAVFRFVLPAFLIHSLTILSVNIVSDFHKFKANLTVKLCKNTESMNNKQCKTVK